MESPQIGTFPTTAPSSSAAPEAPPVPRTVDELLELSQVDLYQVFSRSRPGEVPTGPGRGTPIFFPGTAATKPAAKVFGAIVWRGKVFRGESADLKNLISILAIPAIRARVYRGPSWFDGHECIVLDYTETSRICRWVRDEIREVRPGIYLGLVYGVGRFFGGRRLLDVTFVLSFPPGSRRRLGGTAERES
ncbi:MAG: hypothetical protein M3N47_04510 [Chloroflexota bacterium]|nr:hypothetical protein [Chloroflexota bacterium]